MFNFTKPKATIFQGYTHGRSGLEYQLTAKGENGATIETKNVYCSDDSLESALKAMTERLTKSGYAVKVIQE